MKGRTAEANTLAQFLRDLTSECTVSRLEERYGLSRSVWSEYRSGQKIIPLARLSQIIEDRFVRDPRTREPKLQVARRLHTAAAPASSQFPLPGAAIPASRPAGAVQAPTLSPDSAVGAHGAVPEPAELRGKPAGLSAHDPQRTTSVPPCTRPDTVIFSSEGAAWSQRKSRPVRRSSRGGKKQPLSRACRSGTEQYESDLADALHTILRRP